MQASKQTIRVLLVDDDEDDAVLTRDLLKEIPGAGFEVEWTREYVEGITRLRERGDYDVCLVDYRLGERSGIDFVREVSAWSSAPVILLTGQGDLSVDVAAMNAGAADFLHKGELSASLLERAIRYTIQQRRAEAQRIKLLREQAARAEAEAANRAKDGFLAALSHELRTPLTPVLAILSLWKDDPSVPARLRDDVDMMRRNVELEARLIDDLLDLTRITRGKLQLTFENVAAHQILEQAQQTVRHQAIEKGVQVVINRGAENDRVLADPVRLEQTFWNILSNAVKFTPAGGTVTVSTRNIDPSLLQIQISDTGVGIDPQVLPRIFDAFEQAPGAAAGAARTAGLGLGLAIAKSLIDLHSGGIRASSNGIGQGATFTIQLRAVERSSKTDAKPCEIPGDAAPKLKILLVEDHVTTAEVMARLLDRIGHQVSTANDKQSALRIARSNKFDLLISDLGLPDGSGLDLMNEIRQIRPIRGIAISGFGMEDDIRRSLEAGFSQHLIKPVTIQALATAIDTLASPKKPETTDPVEVVPGR
jgi:signal transduction histidine kinase